MRLEWPNSTNRIGLYLCDLIFVRSHFFAVVFMFLYFFWLKDIGLFSFKYYMFNSLPVMVDLVVRQCSLKKCQKIIRSNKFILNIPLLLNSMIFGSAAQMLN